MAKSNRTVTYTKATINLAEGTITEHLKDGDNVYYIDKLLESWDGVDGISIRITKDEVLPSEE